MSTCFHSVVSVCLFAVYLAQGCSADTTDDAKNSDDGQETESVPGSEADGGLLAEVAPCVFDLVYVSEGGTMLFAEDTSMPACFFSMGFAEFDSGNGKLMEIVSVGDTLDIFSSPGFMVASLDFSCNANSSGVCTADRGVATVMTFEPTFDDVESGYFSGKNVLIQVDAEGVSPGHHARFVGTVRGTL